VATDRSWHSDSCSTGKGIMPKQVGAFVGGMNYSGAQRFGVWLLTLTLDTSECQNHLKLVYLNSYPPYGVLPVFPDGRNHPVLSKPREGFCVLWEEASWRKPSFSLTFSWMQFWPLGVIRHFLAHSRSLSFISSPSLAHVNIQSPAGCSLSTSQDP
jgi:hypothetical protein